jgi:Secretion system C-terminal sorting domain
LQEKEMKAPLFLLLSVFIYAQPQPYSLFNTQTLDKNRITIDVNSYGSSSDLERFQWISGLWDEKYVIYDHGPWLVGHVQGTLKAAIVQWGSSFSPGAITKPFLKDTLINRVYKIQREDDIQNPDYLEWPAHLGAPLDNLGNPLVYGDVMTWNVFNAADTSSPYKSRFWKDYPANQGLPLEIHQIVFQRTAPGFEDMVFYQWEIKHKGQVAVDSIYFSFWSDLDFGNDTANFPAVDSSLGLSYCWSPIDTSFWRGFKIDFAPGYVLLQGPKVDGSFLPVTAFHPIGDDAWGGWLRPAYSPIEVLSLSKGLKPEGKPVINPLTNKVTKFPYNGNPADSTGWNFDYSRTGGGAGFLFSSGPFNMQPGESQIIRMAFLVGQGDDNLDAINDLKEKAAFLKALSFDAISLIEENPGLPENSILLLPNYPNPFNNSTTLRIRLKSATKLKITLFDNLGRRVKTLKPTQFLRGENLVPLDLSSFASGVYFYKVESTGFEQTRKMLLLR